MNKQFMYSILFLLVSCGKSVTEVRPIPTAEVIFTSTLEPTFTRKPIATLNLTATLSPIEIAGATSYQEFLDNNSASGESTEQAKIPILTEFPKLCETWETYLSQNQEWIAVNCLAEGAFSVVNAKGNKIWRVPYKQLYDPLYFPANIGGVFPVNWSQDGRYLYFTKYDCCGDNDLLSYAGPLYRMDLQTGRWLEIVGEGSLSAIVRNAYSFSPTGRRLVYIPERPETSFKIFMRDLSAGTESFIEMPEFEQGGRLVWTNDGLKFAMMAVTGNEFEGNKRFSVVIVNLTDSSYEILVHDVYPDAFPISFSDEGVLQIGLYKYSSDHRLYYLEALYYFAEENRLVAPTLRP